MTIQTPKGRDELFPIIRLRDVNCWILLQRYEVGRRIRLQLITVDDDCPYACATVNVPEASVADDEVLIKDWSENTGVLQALVDAGVVEDTKRTVETGHAQANVARLLIST